MIDVAQYTDSRLSANITSNNEGYIFFDNKKIE